MARAELERLQRRREGVVESYAGMLLLDALDALSGEERRRLYGMLRLEVAPTPEGLEIAGALSTSGIQMVSSTLVMSRSAVRVISSALCFQPPELRFHAVLGDGTRELCFERLLTR